MTERPRAMRRLRLVNEVYHCKHSSYSNQKLVNTGQEPTICAVIKNLKEMNNNPQQAVIAVQEERARIGGIQVAKKTVIAATDEGVVAFQINTVEACGPPNPRPALPSYQPRPALPSSPTTIIVRNEPSGGCCFGCDDDYKWYDLKGKGCCWIMLLLLFYLIVGAILLPFVILGLFCMCLGSMSSDNDD